MLFLRTPLSGPRLIHRPRQVVRRIRHHHLTDFGQRMRELHLMIVHMLPECSAARHDDGDLPGLNSVHDGPGTGVHDQQIGVMDMPDEFFHAKERHMLAYAIVKWRMAVLNNDRPGKLGREAADAFQETRERLQRVTE